MIYTSYFANIRKLPPTMIPISIAGKAPNGYKGIQYKILAPKIGFFTEWKRIKDNDYYIKHFQDEVLSQLNPHKLVSELYRLSKGKDIVLCCYEKPEDFCHRHFVSDWLKKAGYEVEEWNSDLKREEIVVSVTGHRPNKLFGYDMTDERYIIIKNNLKKLLIEKHCTTAVTGMALGIDQLFAEAVLELKEEGNPIKLLTAIPCKNHPCKWPKLSQEHYQDILKEADHMVLVSDSAYEPSLMQIRNEYMVNISNVVIAVWDGSRGGTGNCVEYAKKVNRPVIVINPK
ncbi:SLOG family protein [Lacrimispora amygdalina]|uniref:DUF488 family protein, N3 subclade n=1 Tax=Lacrimispora amygdalina TaxID=253257 RepID=UPI001142AD66|nr:SLOG family protein [Lacrimispora amygdalina]